MIKILSLLVLFFSFTGNIYGVKIKKSLQYTTHILKDTTLYKQQVRIFQWQKISDQLDSLTNCQKKFFFPGILKNYKNTNGIPPLTAHATLNSYNNFQDSLGVEQKQSVPFYQIENLSIPACYGRDGALIYVLKESSGFFKIKPFNKNTTWMVPQKYIQLISPGFFKKVIFVDRTNQNLATLEYADSIWLVRSMVPVTTGVHKPPYERETPKGVFVLQNKIPKMIFMKDGSSTEKGGFAPYASRFTNGAYLHGVPVNYPDSTIIEYSPTLGTVPRSHMCVRNPASHAKFIYDWAPINETLIFVFD